MAQLAERRTRNAQAVGPNPTDSSTACLKAALNDGPRHSPGRAHIPPGPDAWPRGRGTPRPGHGTMTSHKHAQTCLHGQHGPLAAGALPPLRRLLIIRAGVFKSSLSSPAQVNFRGIVQLEAHLVRDQEAAGSNPAAPTISPLHLTRWAASLIRPRRVFDTFHRRGLFIRIPIGKLGILFPVSILRLKVAGSDFARKNVQNG